MRAPVRIGLTLAACGLALAPAGAGAASQRPDLVISKGTVAVKHGRLAGSFVVRNAGRAPSHRSTAALTVKASGRTRVVKRFTVPALERPIATVRAETDALKAAGFPITRIEQPGTHYDADTPTTGTDHDLRTLLLPHMADGWLAPG
jgi:hypothetical protein